LEGRWGQGWEVGELYQKEGVKGKGEGKGGFKGRGSRKGGSKGSS